MRNRIFTTPHALSIYNFTHGLHPLTSYVQTSESDERLQEKRPDCFENQGDSAQYAVERHRNLEQSVRELYGSEIVVRQ